MAGSYLHIVDERGRLLSPEKLVAMLDTGGDVYEAIEELFGMIWVLAAGNAEVHATDVKVMVEFARQNYQTGLDVHWDRRISGLKE